MKIFTKLEQQAIEQILKADLPGIDIARLQYAHATVISRDITTVGFFTKMSISHEIAAMPDNIALRQHLFSGATATVPEIPGELITFKLWEDENRYLTCLEATTTLGKWPEDRRIVLNSK